MRSRFISWENLFIFLSGRFSGDINLYQNDQNRSNTGNRFSLKKDRSVCTHCGYLGHTIDKCYKLHGYSPCYKPRQKSHYNNNTTNSAPQVNQVSESVMALGNNFVQIVSPSQCSQLLSMLSSHLKEAKHDDNSASTLVKGTCLSAFNLHSAFQTVFFLLLLLLKVC